MSRVSQLQPHPYECFKRSSLGRARCEARGSTDRVCTYNRHWWGVTVYCSDGTSRGNMKMEEKERFNAIREIVLLENFASIVKVIRRACSMRIWKYWHVLKI